MDFFKVENNKNNEFTKVLKSTKKVIRENERILKSDTFRKNKRSKSYVK